MAEHSQAAAYQITVRGRIDPEWVQSFQGRVLKFDGESTLLSSPAADQAALRGLLCCLWDFNVTILSVVWVPSTEPCEEGG